MLTQSWSAIELTETIKEANKGERRKVICLLTFLFFSFSDGGYSMFYPH